MSALTFLVCAVFTVLLHQHANGKLGHICKTSEEVDFDESYFTIFGTERASLLQKSPTEKTVRTGSKAAARCPASNADKTTMCPHHSVLNYDPNRIPAIVFEARCSCTRCLGHHSDTRNLCKPLYYYRQILIKDEDRSCYVRKVKPFAVGCQCHLLKYIITNGQKSSAIFSRYNRRTPMI